MFKLSSAGIAAIVALAGLAAPAQAALVTYDFWAASGTGTRQDFDCTTSPACTVVTTNFAISGISMTVVVDTSAGMPQFGNPDGGAGSTSLGGGSYYGYPVGVSASFNIAGPTPFSSGPFALGRGSDVYGEASFASFYGYDDLFTSTVDPQTSNRTSTALSRTLSIGMTDPGPIVFIGGEWLPGMSGLALGSMMFNQQF
ncbi:MAG: hypothetical protein INF91_08045, partial [Alphaproteobacteria bacterium]|nr:hypothetical protein [Alphaproteobacteria bacterium]